MRGFFFGQISSSLSHRITFSQNTKFVFPNLLIQTFAPVVYHWMSFPTRCLTTVSLNKIIYQISLNFYFFGLKPVTSSLYLHKFKL